MALPSSAARTLLLGAPLLLCSALPGAAMMVATLSSSPARAQEVENGLLRVKATVDGAQVYVDNKEIGVTPITTYLPPGDHTVRVSADNFDPFVRRVTVTTGRTVELVADLLPGAGTVEFIAEPAGATLTLNDREQYPTPVRLRDLQPGDYRWRLAAPAHEPQEGSFTFTRGKNLLFTPRLDSSAGRFSVASRPEGAEVFLDGQLVGTTPLELRDIPPGVHQVLLDMKGQAAVLRTVDTSDGSRGQVDVRLPDDGAALVVKTPSADATVRLNGVKVGSGRKVRLPELERGRYTLEVTAPGRPTAETRIEVPDGGGAWWKARMTGRQAELREYTPLVRSWAFWAGTSAVAAGATTGAILAYNAGIPDPTPEGDILVTLP
ncbi:PEGA domain-containing protein [Myxococcota bacterium]|nr:PEGA domain-containing protein [Myxococcota bacterium]